MNSQSKITKLRPAELVIIANRFATSMGCVEPPELEASTVGKMGLKGVAGLRVAKRGRAPGGPPGEDGARRKRR